MQRKHFWLIFLFICFIISGLVGNYLAKITEVPSSYQNKISKKPFEKQVVSQDAEILFGTYFSTCNHLVKKPADTDVKGLTLPALQKRYPLEDGWILDTLNPKHIMIYKKVEGLCPEDDVKRHLGVKGEYLAVYKGPIGLSGSLERVTDIKVSELPPDFKSKLDQGQLNFASNDELLEALDTIDEYKE